ncbi:MAG TPA: hypothetical protein VLB67_11310 [Acidimicrobiia bacterium]|nr:hypothetical protein [Acidimicrobiia bacterium]
MAAHTPFLDGGLTWIYGAPPPDECPECSFGWDLAFEDALRIIAAAPDRFEAALQGRDGMAVPADGSWNAGAYVWHLTDLARGWSERWVQIQDAPGSRLIGFDPDELAAARNYRQLPVDPGLWALRQAVATLLDTTGRLDRAAVFEHGDWGPGTVADAIRWLAHEFHHHEQDVIGRAG